MTSRPRTGLAEGRLGPCPGSPNCVCSDGEAADIDPFRFTGPADVALLRLREVVSAMPRTRLAEATDGYLRYEVRSRIFRFVDDLEFRIDPAASVIHVRSASRLGHSDLGVNRRRVEHLRAEFSAKRASDR
jgi:uncharacterized protein (DUF1499 family)